MFQLFIFFFEVHYYIILFLNLIILYFSWNIWILNLSLILKFFLCTVIIILMLIIIFLICKIVVFHCWLLLIVLLLILISLILLISTTYSRILVSYVWGRSLNFRLGLVLFSVLLSYWLALFLNLLLWFYCTSNSSSYSTCMLVYLISSWLLFIFLRRSSFLNLFFLNFLFLFLS